MLIARFPTLIAAAALCCACTATRTVYDVTENYTAHAEVEITRSEEFELADFDVAWEGIVKFFATSQIPIATLEKESGIIVARKTLSDSTATDLIHPGSIHSIIQPVEETLTPSEYAGSANAAYVRRNGKVTKRTPIESGTMTMDRVARYKVSVAFNVFVERFGDKRLRVTINTAFDPDGELHLLSGWFWPGDKGLSDNSPAGILAAFMVSVPSGFRAHEPAPVSTGLFERTLLNYVATQVVGKPARQ